MPLLISTGKPTQETLKNKTAIVTGAGRGIGFETARSLLWLGANVVIAELNKTNGQSAQELLSKEFGLNRILFVQA